ncbi:MAG: sulfotransferase [Nevskia sp.]|nr:sulfotransferase [Nevskia sp.]
MLDAPVLIVAPPGAHASRLAAMLGQHSHAQDLPELSLFMAKTVGGLGEISALSDGLTTQGLRRAIAAIHFGSQQDAAIADAERWLARRSDWQGAMMLTEFAQRLVPKTLVSTDTTLGWRPDFLDRLLDEVPDIRLLHLVEHPRRWCRETAAALDGRLFIPPDYKDYAVSPPIVDPQLAWLRVHGNIAEAGGWLHEAQYHVLNVEALLARPEAALSGICEWLGWSAAGTELDAMQRPEFGAFAGIGPSNALHGADERFLADPMFVRRLRSTDSLHGALEWRPEVAGFAPEVLSLAERFQYR